MLGLDDPAYDRASDPWVTFDTDGNAYQISLSVSADQVTSVDPGRPSRPTGSHLGERRSR